MCYTPKCAPNQYLHGGSWTTYVAPIDLEKIAIVRSYPDIGL